MRYKKALVGVLVAAALTLTPAISATASPVDTNPLVQNAEFKYNGSTFSINVKPAAGSKYVQRDSYRVSDTYTVRVTQDVGAYGKLVYSSNLGYTRTAYLHTKLVGLEGAPEGGLNLKRDYGINTYIKKVVGFSAGYARGRIDTLTANYREARLRADVTATAQHVRTYLIKNNTLAGIQNDPTVVSNSEGYFGYSGDNVSVRLFVDPADTKNETFEVVGVEKPDLYQSVHDSATGAVRSGTISTVTNLD